MDLRILEDFLRVAELGSFSLAAERRGSTQSAFSRRIQGLETWIGASLIDRKSNPLRLTSAGEAFKELAEDVLRSIKHGREEIHSIANQTTAATSFAVTHSLTLNFFPRWIREIERDTGPLSLKLLSNDGEKCREALTRGECHFMICHFSARMAEDFHASRLKSQPFGNGPIDPGFGADCEFQSAGQDSGHAPISARRFSLIRMVRIWAARWICFCRKNRARLSAAVLRDLAR